MQRPTAALAFVLLAFSVGAQPIDAERHDKLVNEGMNLIYPYISLADRPARPVDTDAARAEIKAGIEDLKQVVAINPDNASAYWVMGMGYGALRDYGSSADMLGKAYEFRRTQPDFGREYAHALMCSGATQQAVQIAQAVSDAHPADAGLMANLALAFLVDKRFDAAEAAAQAALKLDPSDEVTRRLGEEIVTLRETHAKVNSRHYCL